MKKSKSIKYTSQPMGKSRSDPGLRWACIEDHLLRLLFGMSNHIIGNKGQIKV